MNRSYSIGLVLAGCILFALGFFWLCATLQYGLDEYAFTGATYDLYLFFLNGESAFKDPIQNLTSLFFLLPTIMAKSDPTRLWWLRTINVVPCFVLALLCIIDTANHPSTLRHHNALKASRFLVFLSTLMLAPITSFLVLIIRPDFIGLTLLILTAFLLFRASIFHFYLNPCIHACMTTVAAVGSIACSLKYVIPLCLLTSLFVLMTWRRIHIHFLRTSLICVLILVMSLAAHMNAPGDIPFMGRLIESVVVHQSLHVPTPLTFMFNNIRPGDAMLLIIGFIMCVVEWPLPTKHQRFSFWLSMLYVFCSLSIIMQKAPFYYSLTPLLILSCMLLARFSLHPWHSFVGTVIVLVCLRLSPYSAPLQHNDIQVQALETLHTHTAKKDKGCGISSSYVFRRRTYPLIFLDHIRLKLYGDDYQRHVTSRLEERALDFYIVSKRGGNTGHASVNAAIRENMQHIEFGLYKKR